MSHYYGTGLLGTNELVLNPKTMTLAVQRFIDEVIDRSLTPPEVIEVRPSDAGFHVILKESPKSPTFFARLQAKWTRKSS